MDWAGPLLAAVLLAAISAQAQTSYAITRFKIAGGGGTSTNAQFSLTGTIGQHDTGAMSGGSFTLGGGFWGVVTAVQTPGAPLLSITRTQGNVIVSWPLPALGWVLAQTNHLAGASGPWPPVSATYATNATTISVTVPIAPGNLFFRLQKQ